MSAEVAKKRGRPKKVISDPVEVELPETAKKATTRAKSTKTTTKTAKDVPSTSAKATPVKKTVTKASGAPTTPKTAKAAAPSAKAVEKPVDAKPTPTTPTTSKILEQVKEMEAKKDNISPESTKGTTEAAGKAKVELAPKPAKEAERLQQQSTTKPSTEPSKTQPTMAAKSTLSSSQAKPLSSTNSPGSKPTTKTPPPPSKSTAPPPPSGKPTPKPHIPIAELNSTIVSNITTRAGAKPNTAGSQQLPKNYKPVARKVTMAIVALPIAIVTSYVLYQRLVLGEEKKLFPMPRQRDAETEAKIEPSSSDSSSSPASKEASGKLRLLA
ncbi:hypothetical protein BKA64DRAFT_707944 [Cadophora sp. MPI-SDFR-AT-0126]|nr:hypothetical protein BKA64DRAFT_707944 [Leotiomycetes sp. MPI-SDFR-AT-0126]